MASIKQLPNTAATLPVRNLPQELMGADVETDQELWTAVRTLIERFNKANIASGSARARINAQGSGVVATLPANTWVVLPVTTIVSTVSAINFSLANNRMTYTGVEPNNVHIEEVFHTPNATTGVVDLGFRRNGDNASIVPQTVSANRSEFTAPAFAVFDVEQSDYIEAVIRSATVQANVNVFLTIYMQQTEIPFGA